MTTYTSYIPTPNSRLIEIITSDVIQSRFKSIDTSIDETEFERQIFMIFKDACKIAFNRKPNESNLIDATDIGRETLDSTFDYLYDSICNNWDKWVYSNSKVLLEKDKLLIQNTLYSLRIQYITDNITNLTDLIKTDLEFLGVMISCLNSDTGYLDSSINRIQYRSDIYFILETTCNILISDSEYDNFRSMIGRNSDLNMDFNDHDYTNVKRKQSARISEANHLEKETHELKDNIDRTKNLTTRYHETIKMLKYKRYQFYVWTITFMIISGVVLYQMYRKNDENIIKLIMYLFIAVLFINIFILCINFLKYNIKRLRNT